MKQFRIRGWVIWILAIIVMPWVVRNDYYRSVLVTFGFFSVFALSLNIIVGYIGEISFGHATFFGIGAYTSALLAKDLGLSYLTAVVGSIVLSGLLGLFIGYLVLRLRGAYFAITTLAFAEILRLLSTNWAKLTGGPLGLTKIPWPTMHFFGIYDLAIKGELSYYYFTVLLVLLTVVIVFRLIKSPTGRAFLAIREHQDLASSVGINVFKYKVLAFTISSMLAGMAGSAYAHFFRIISPDLFGTYYSAIALLMVMVGGRGTIAGPIVGAFIFTILPETLRGIGSLRISIFSGLLLVTILFMPEGLIKGIGQLIAKRKVV
jgi:branched-chain amino acid transport system permease protein